MNASLTSPSPPTQTLLTRFKTPVTQISQRSTDAQESGNLLKLDARPKIGVLQELGELTECDVNAVKKLGGRSLYRKYYAFHGVPVRLHNNDGLIIRLPMQ